MEKLKQTKRSKIEVIKKAVAASTLAGLSIVALGGCTTQADTVSRNVSVAADNFEVDRKITFINGITDSTPLIIEGRCSIEADRADEQLEVTCKVGEGDDDFYKHFLGLSDNMAYIVEQTEPTEVDPFHHRVIIRPETLVPEFDLETSGEN